MDTNELVGKVLKCVKIASDKKAVLFQTSNGDVIARTDGDCCSDSWVEHIELPALGFPAKVLSVEDLKMPQAENSDGYPLLKVYGCKIATDKGDIVLDYRNRSNGYYGGNICWPGDYFYGGVFGQNKSEENWVDIEK